MCKKWFVWLCCVLAENGYGQGFPVIITELLPDPVPAIGLPSEEFIELKNISDSAVGLGGWTISNGRSSAKIPDGVLLLPDSMLICCKESAVLLYASFGTVIGLAGFPSLSNDGDTIWLENEQGAIVHALRYTNRDYHGLPTDGRTLELSDPASACSMLTPWLPGAASAGGTPGKIREPTGNTGTPELDPKKSTGLLYAYAEGPLTVVLVWDDAITDPGLIRLTPGLSIESSAAIAPFFNAWRFRLRSPMVPGQQYTCSAQQFSTCLDSSGAIQGYAQEARLALADSGFTGLVINELMWNPPAGGSDYVELFNAGPKVIDLRSLSFASRNAAGAVVGKKSLSHDGRCLFPGEYMAFTSDVNWLGKQYHLQSATQIVELDALPSLPNLSGHLLLLDEQENTIDELAYSDDWQHVMIRLSDGIALERIDPKGKTQDPGNWASAPTHAGYGTPGYKNAQAETTAATDPTRIEVDIGQVLIHYAFDEPGYLISIQAYAFDGRLLCNIVRNGICSREGVYRWNGRDDQGRGIRPGPYLLVIDAFNLQGKTLRYRKPIGISW